MERYGRDYGGRPGGAGPGYDMEFGNWGDRSGLRGSRSGYDREHRGAARGGYGGRPRFTGMESNRYRGVEGSGFRVRYGREYHPAEEGNHGGYRGTGWDRGGGMNPGRRRGYGL